MGSKKKVANEDILTSIARTVGTTAGLIVSTANRLTASSKSSAGTKKTTRRRTKKKAKAVIKPKTKMTKRTRRTATNNRK